MAGSRQAAAELVARIQQLARPRYVNGVWKKPLVSGRELAAARRALAAEGMDWPVRPLRDRSQDKPFKLNRREREREERKKRIEENMQRMPEMIEEYRRQRRERREAERRGKEKTEEQKYLLATGKMKEEGPHWQIFKDSKR